MSIPEKRLSALLRDLKICTKDLLGAWTRHIRQSESYSLPDPDSPSLPESLASHLFSKKTSVPAGDFLLFYLRLFCECRALGEGLSRFKPAFAVKRAWNVGIMEAASVLERVSGLAGLQARAIEAVNALSGEWCARIFEDKCEPSYFDETTFTPEELFSAQVQHESFAAVARVLEELGLFPELAKNLRSNVSKSDDWIQKEGNKLWPGEKIELEEDLRRRRFDTLNILNTKKNEHR